MEEKNLHSFAQDAITKYHRLGGLNDRNSFSYSAGGWESKIKVSAGLVSPEASLLGLQMAALLLPFHMVILLGVWAPGVSLSVQISSSYKEPVLLD